MDMVPKLITCENYSSKVQIPSETKLTSSNILNSFSLDTDSVLLVELVGETLFWVKGYEVLVYNQQTDSFNYITYQPRTNNDFYLWQQKAKRTFLAQYEAMFTFAGYECRRDPFYVDNQYQRHTLTLGVYSQNCCIALFLLTTQPNDYLHLVDECREKGIVFFLFITGDVQAYKREVLESLMHQVYLVSKEKDVLPKLTLPFILKEEEIPY